jgi:hypothetical protein
MKGYGTCAVLLLMWILSKTREQLEDAYGRLIGTLQIFADAATAYVHHGDGLSMAVLGGQGSDRGYEAAMEAVPGYLVGA